MSYNNRLQANNAELREAIELAESLPDAGTVVGTEPYEGEYIVTPKVEAQTMPTKEKVMLDDVTIKAIPYAEVSQRKLGLLLLRTARQLQKRCM